MFLLPSDFNKLPYSIANNDGDNAVTLQSLCDRVEKELLVKVLGLDLYNEFVLGVEALPDAWDAEVNYVLNDEVYQGVTIWQALQPNTDVIPVEGADWTKVEDNKWLKLRDGFSYKYPVTTGRTYMYEGVKSFLIPFAFYTWVIEFSGETQTDGGVVVSDLENGTNVGVRDIAVRAYNDAARKIGKNVEVQNTLWGYLFETFEDDYPDLHFCPLPKVNYFDI